jgi:hypothetical protein
MKKILLLTNLVTASILISFLLKGCSQPQNNESTKDSKEVSKRSEADIVLNYADTVFKSLTIDQAMEMKKSFLMDNKELDNTKSVVFSLNSIKNLVWYIEHHAKQTKLNINPDSLGITIHFAQYPSLEVLDKLGYELSENHKKNYANKNTVFFVPTIKRGGELVEFDPKRNHMESGKADYKDIIPLNVHYKQMSSPFKNVDYTDGSPIANLGHLQPPPANNFD